LSRITPLGVGPAVPGPPVLGRPGCHPDPIDPHAAIGRLVEAFEEILDLGRHLFILHGLGRLVDVHYHGPLEVGHGTGYAGNAVIVRQGAQSPTGPP
jgi:hypothetical protein